jgi:hypothetical protein
VILLLNRLCRFCKEHDNEQLNGEATERKSKGGRRWDGGK